jgi:hypothetical protein
LHSAAIATQDQSVRFVRFVIAARSSSSGKRLGVIRAASRYEDKRLFSATESDEVLLLSRHEPEIETR